MRQYLPIAVCSLLVTACETPGITLVEPETQGADAMPAVVHVAPEDSAMAAALGWQVGVPGARVIVQRFIDPFQPDTLWTDSSGRVTLAGFLPGWYLVAGERALGVGETGPTGGVVRAFADGVKTNLPQQLVELRLARDETGSLVISEIYFGGGMVGLSYGFDKFIELYNNSDTTVFVDGMVLARAYSMVGSNEPCATHVSVREDSLGLWSRTFHEFPGSGADYPVLPGEVVTIALDAVDHSVVHASLPDLSNADFELEGSADVDNPDVPNLPDLSFSRFAHQHGMTMNNNAAYFLALPVSIDELSQRDFGGSEYVRIPRDRVVDVVQLHWVDPSSAPPFVLDEYCPWVNRRFDRLETPWYRPGADNRTSSHRRIIRKRPAGAPVLQDTNTSFVDWILAPYSPGSIRY